MCTTSGVCDKSSSQPLKIIGILRGFRTTELQELVHVIQTPLQGLNEQLANHRWWNCVVIGFFFADGVSLGVSFFGLRVNRIVIGQGPIPSATFGCKPRVHARDDTHGF